MVAMNLATAPYYHWAEKDLFIAVYVQPKARQDAWLGPMAQRGFKIRLSAPPLDGQANEQLVSFLAQQFGVAKSQISIIKGHRSRQKILCIHAPKKLPDAIEIA